ncbi:MAG: Methyltransferase type 12 [Solirubrobacterales bacterium]|nr:Methyltransferase type 12 [Solirubrobacterales bacterium]
MDAVERLSLEQAGDSSLIALTHVHRYELAAELCAGMRVLDLCCGSGYGARILAGSAAAVTGVDRHQPSIGRASEELGDGERLAFEVGDAHEWLERPLAERFDAIVLLDGLEHLADLGRALDRLRAHAEAGLTLIVSVPNSRRFGEQNPDHVLEFDLETALAAFKGLPGATVLNQFHAEGSLIRAAPSGEGLAAHMTLAERTDAEHTDAEHADHYIALVNAEGEPLERAGSSRMQLAVTASFNRYMVDLEQQNRALRRANQRLARERLGVADSAAASVLRRERGRELRPGLERVAGGGTKVARGLATVVLNILPHAITLVLLRIRSRLRQDRSGE